MPASGSSQDAATNGAPDLFKSENDALDKARSAFENPDASGQEYRQSLGELIGHFERLMRETRRLIGRSDRAEREMHALNMQLQALAQQLEYRATHDALTGVFNRSAVIELATKALAEGDAVMVVLDIDYFKRINDEFGHPAGDSVILGIVTCLRRIVGDEGIIGRVGGEEFTVVLPGYQLQQAVELAEAMRAAIAEHRFEPPVDRQITASFGLSANTGGTDFDAAYGLADEALYAAKRNGRNCVEIAQPAPPGAGS
ncbi:signaling protein [Bordetella ansorpii]|uniref:diguanylate cyclase n=1 Tax=Bordetella ansorpii TaxID=288768 RepID=A0A157SK92_9BORD|nr:GGDEF domain-containing protein [Bordetella ansorpii]SAI70882.1 signaling protein [Bordetella ansorpii]